MMECDLSMYFEKAGDLWWAKSKDGRHSLPILFCPICGRRLDDSGSPEE